MNQSVVFLVYAACEMLPPWAYVTLCLSKRVHSIFVLRMFNDGVAEGVGVRGGGRVSEEEVDRGKRRVLVGRVRQDERVVDASGFARRARGRSERRGGRGVGGRDARMTQVALGAPVSDDLSKRISRPRLRLGRVFTHKWSVNFKFVPEDVFTSKAFAGYLMAAHLTLLFVFAHFRWYRKEGGFFFAFVRDFFRRAVKNCDGVQSTFTPAHVALVLAESNLIGVVFARSLHYQFYSWYFHTLPLLLWSNTRVPVAMKLAFLGAIEWCWNVYPSTARSSKIFVAIHVILLGVVFVVAARLLKRSRRRSTSRSR